MSQFSYSDFRRKVVGEAWIDEDKVVKTTTTKNTMRCVIHRTRSRAILLECGHKVAVTLYAKVPSNNTWCRACEILGA